VRPIAVEWPLPKVQGSVASQDDEWQVPAAAVIELQNLTGSNQPARVIRSVKSYDCTPQIHRWNNPLNICCFARIQIAHASRGWVGATTTPPAAAPP
jgi:hypothetical protein